MKFVKRILSHITPNLIIYFLIANLLLIFSNIPLLLRFLRTPEGMSFNFSHTLWDHDYGLYRSAIIQGKSGFWLYHDAVTSEKTTPGIFYIFYVIVGKFAWLFNLSSVIAYHLARIISVELFFILLYFLTNILLGNYYGLWAAFIALISTVSPLFIFKEKLEVGFGVPWWTNFGALERLNSLPHYIFANDLLIASVILILLFFKNDQVKYAVLAGILIFIGGIFFPAVLSPIGIALPLSIFFIFLRNLFIKPKIRQNKKIFIGLYIIFIFSFLSLLACKYQEKQGFPWNETFTSWQVNRWNYSEPNFNYNAFFVLGILPILSIPAILKNLQSGNTEFIFISIWSILPLILLPFVNILQIPKLRLLEDSHFISYAILASQSLSIINSKLNLKFIKNIIIIFLLIITIQVEVNIFLWKISFITDNFAPGLFYFQIAELSGIKYIEEAIPANSIILSQTSYIFPAYAPVISYWGHMALTKNFSLKQENSRLFFSNQMPETEAKKLLFNNRIHYVYWGPEEKKLSSKPLSYNFLIPVYQDSNVTIFQVQIL